MPATPRQKLDAAAKTYRRIYDRLYVASMKANDAAECEKIDATLAAANAAYDKAKAEYAAVTA